MRETMRREIRGQPNKTVMRDLMERYRSRMVKTINEQMSVDGVVACDKIFCSVWLDDHRVVTGSKDNRLVLWDMEKKRLEELFRRIDLPKSGNVFSSNNCGIHSLAMSPGRRYLISGATDPAELAVFDAETMRPMKILTGHKNWSFCSGFLTENHVISGSRDSHIAVWDIEDKTHDIISPVVNVKAHSTKVRDLEILENEGRFITLGSDGSLKVWDQSNIESISVIYLEEINELICLKSIEERNLVAVGSQCHISFYDPRNNSLVRKIDSVDDDAGVRSFEYSGDVLNIGGGKGRLSFFDLVADAFIPVCTDSYYSTKKNHNDDVAIYTQSYSPQGSKLFVGGGPLMYTRCGSYGGLWF